MTMNSSSSLAEPLLSEEPTTDSSHVQRPSGHEPAPILVVEEEEEPLRSSMVSVSFVLAVMVAVVPMLMFGFNTGVLNAPESVIFPGHSVWEWSLAVSAFCIGGFLGAYSFGNLADTYGRRPCLLVILVLNIIFGIVHVLAPHMWILIGARVGVGIAGGASTVLTPMYLSEISPRDIRGSIGTLTQLSCVLGILVSILWALPFCTRDKWRLIFLPIPAMAGIGLLAGICWLPESPQWLLLNHYVRRGEEARDTIRRFRNFSEDNEEEVEMEVLLSLRRTEPPNQEEVVDEDDPTRDDEQLVTTDDIIMRDDDTTMRSFYSYVMDPKTRIRLTSSILFPIAQQLSGINAVFYYSTLFFDGVISDPQMGTIIAFSLNVVATIVALLLMDKFGRKTLLTLSAGGMFVCCILLTLSLKGFLPGMVTFGSVMLYISFFEMGLGCIPFFLASELIEPEFLGKVQSLSMSSNWFSNFCVGLLFPYMDQYLGAYSFVPFAIVLFGTVLYSILVLPETRGKSLEQVLQELEERGSQRVALEPPADDVVEPVEPESEIV